MQGIMTNPETGDIIVQDGRIIIGDNSRQCIEQILVSNRGEYKEYPLVGGEILKMLHGDVSRFWPARVRNMCNSMGVSVKRVSMDNNGKIKVER